MNDQGPTETRAAFEAGGSAACVANRHVTINGIPCVLLNQGQNLVPLEQVLALEERLRPAPHRRKGGHVATELGSFIAIVNRFKSEQSAIFADVAKPGLLAVFNFHPKGPSETGWCDHTARYACPLTEEWELWNNHSGEFMSQDAFGDHIERRFEDLTSKDGYPEPIDVLTLARDLTISVNTRYQRKLDRTTGDSTLLSKTETDQLKETKIPRAFMLGLPVFVGGARYAVEARVRMKMQDGLMRFGYELHRADEILAHAFQDVRDEAQKATELPLYAGAP